MCATILDESLTLAARTLHCRVTEKTAQTKTFLPLVDERRTNMLGDYVKDAGPKSHGNLKRR